LECKFSSPFKLKNLFPPCKLKHPSALPLTIFLMMESSMENTISEAEFEFDTNNSTVIDKPPLNGGELFQATDN
jgi:hypothetical protein